MPHVKPEDIQFLFSCSTADCEAAEAGTVFKRNVFDLLESHEPTCPTCDAVLALIPPCVLLEAPTAVNAPAPCCDCPKIHSIESYQREPFCKCKNCHA